MWTFVLSSQKIKQFAELQDKLRKFADQCPQSQRGRPVSNPSAAQEKGISLCEKKRKRDGETIYYKTSEQKEKEKKIKSEQAEKRKQITTKARGRLPKISREQYEELKAKLEEVTGKLKAKETEKKEVEKPGTVAEVNPDEIKVDPKRFQYKIAGEHVKTGEVGSLEGVQKYDPNLAGLIQVWRDPKDGNTYVVNGHNRLALANRLGAEKVAIRYLDVQSDKEARAVGALTNIAEGKGTSLDAAKFFRDTGITKEDLLKKGVPFRESYAQEGLALAGLEKMLFGMAIDGNIPIKQAAIIGGSGLSDNQQYKLYEIVKKQEKQGRNITDDLMRETVDFVKSTQTTKKKNEDLFGEFEEEDDNIFDKLSLQSGISKKLSREQRIFGTVGKKRTAEELSKGGNVIDVETSAARAKAAQEATSLFDALKNTKGTIADMLNKAANRIKTASSKQAKEKIQEEVYEMVLAELPKAAGLKK